MHQFYLQNYQYCPRCKAKLKQKADGLLCPVCNFSVYDNPALGTIVLFEQNKKILLAKRKFNPHAGDWDSIGGFVQSNETAEQAALREVKEEIGVEAKIIKYLGSLTGKYAGIPVLDIVFWAQIKDGQATADDDVAEIKWFNLNNLPKNFAFIRVQTAIQLLKKELQNS